MSISDGMVAAVNGARDAGYRDGKQDERKAICIRLMNPDEEIYVALREWSYKKYGKPIGKDATNGVCKELALVLAGERPDATKTPQGS